MISKQAKQHKGLTLVELLVAISVLAIVAVLGWRGLDSIVRARIALTADLEQTRGVQLAFAQLQSDCQHLANDSTLINRAAINAQPTQLNLIRMVYSDNQPSRLQVVSYQVTDGVLTRRESAATRDMKMLDDFWQAAILQRDKDIPVTLQTDVTALTVRVWQSSNNGWASPVATATPSSRLTGLEVALQLKGDKFSLLKVFLLGAA